MAEWMPRDEWDRLYRGEDCPLCRPQPAADEYGVTIEYLPAGVLRLCRDQFSRGYCILISNEHGPEPHSIERPGDYFADVTRAGAAIEAACGADKMNYLTLGNAVPHLHTHLIPRYYGDPEPGRPYLTGPDPILLADEADYEELAAAIRLKL